MDPGNFHTFLRGFFGFNNAMRNHPSFPRDEDEHENDMRAERSTVHNFQVFTDPLEIHRFFEQQMEEMFREFRGIGEILDGKGFMEEWDHKSSEHQASITLDEKMSDRDMMLKHDDYIPRQKEDNDYDDKKLTAEDLSELFQKRVEDREQDIPRSELCDPPLVPAPGLEEGTVRTFSFSRSTRTVQRPDGSLEIEERTRNPDGSETVTIRRSNESSRGDSTVLFSDQGRLFGSLFGFDSQNTRFPSIEEEQPNRAPDGPYADRKYTSIFSKFFGH